MYVGSFRTVKMRRHSVLRFQFIIIAFLGVLASEGWWEAWQPSRRYPISGQRQSWKTPRWAWGKQVHGMWYFYLHCFDTVGWATGRASGLWKNRMLVCWWWWFDWSFAWFIAPVVTTTSIILCFNKHQLTGSPGKWPLKRRERQIMMIFRLSSVWTFV